MNFLELVVVELYSPSSRVSFRCQPLLTSQNSWVSSAIRGTTTAIAIVREVSRFSDGGYKASCAAS